MRKLLMSLGVIGVVSAVGFMATSAFFSDTETSTGNVLAAGEIDLMISSEAHYNGLVCVEDQDSDTGYSWQLEDDNNTAPTYPEVGSPCTGTWEAKDLDGDTFFDYEDLKPGDHGENTIDIEVMNNDAYMCAYVENLSDSENGQSEPEQEVDTTPEVGELSSELYFVAWEDDGDNVWQQDENILLQGPASDALGGAYWEMYGPGSEPFPGGETRYVGLYWCYGEVSTDNGLSCDGASVTNASQTDGLTADIRFYIEQARNNEDFSCPVPVTATEYQDWPAYTDGFGEKLWEAEARFGGDNTWEAGVGLNTQTSSQTNNQTGPDYDWGNGDTVPFTLTYDSSTGDATFTVDTIPGQVYDVSTTAAAGEKLFLAVKASDADDTVEASNLEVNSNSIAGTISSSGSPVSWEIMGIDPSDDFTLTGDLTFTYSDTPSGSGLVFKVEISD